MNHVTLPTGIALPQKQQGAVLIAVLLFLILITIAGVVAVRQSRLDMMVATSDQINTVLLQSADNAQAQLETAINGLPSTKDYRALTSPNGPFGYFLAMSQPQNAPRRRHTYVFCQRPDIAYAMANSTIEVGDGGKIGGNRGYCANKPLTQRFSTDRGISTVQVAISPYYTDLDAVPVAEPLSGLQIGQDAEKSIKERVIVRATSALPAYSDNTDSVVTQHADIEQIKQCKEYSKTGKYKHCILN